MIIFALSKILFFSQLYNRNHPAQVLCENTFVDWEKGGMT